MGKQFLSDCNNDDLLLYDLSYRQTTKSEHITRNPLFSKQQRSDHVQQADYVCHDAASDHGHSAASTKGQNSSIRRRLNPRERGQQPSLGEPDESSEIRASDKHSHHNDSDSTTTITSSEEDDYYSSSEDDDDDSSTASFGEEDAPSEGGALNTNSGHRTRPRRLSHTKSADQARSFKQNDRPNPSSTKSDECLRPHDAEDAPSEGALNRNSAHRTRPRLSRTTSARSFKQNDRSNPSSTKSDECLRHHDAEDAPSEGALNRNSAHRTRPHLSRTTSARFFKQNDRQKAPSRTKSDECLRPHAAEDAPSEGALNRNSVRRTRSHLSRTTSARSFKQNDRPKSPSRTKSDECLMRPHGGEDAPSDEGALNRNSVHRTRPRLSRTTSASRFSKKNDKPKPPSRTKSDDCLMRPNTGGLAVHTARQTRRECIKEQYRVDDLASLCAISRSDASTSMTMMRRIQGTIGLDGVPANANDTFPKYTDEKFRRCRAVRIDGILNEAKHEQGRKVGKHCRLVLQVNKSADRSIPKYGEDDDDDDDQPRVKGDGMSTSFRHLAQGIVKTSAKVTKSTAKGSVNVVRDPKRVAKKVGN
jgi:hypothetical protein